MNFRFISSSIQNLVEILISVGLSFQNNLKRKDLLTKLYLLVQEQGTSSLITLFRVSSKGQALYACKFHAILITSIPSIFYSVDIHYIFYLIIVCTRMRCFIKKRQKSKRDKDKFDLCPSLPWACLPIRFQRGFTSLWWCHREKILGSGARVSSLERQKNQIQLSPTILTHCLSCTMRPGAEGPAPCS